MHDSMVLGVKIVSAQDNVITTISLERDGAVSISKFQTKGLFQATKMQDINKYFSKFKNPRTLAINRPDDRFKDTLWEKRQLVAIGASSHIVIC